MASTKVQPMAKQLDSLRMYKLNQNEIREDISEFIQDEFNVLDIPTFIKFVNLGILKISDHVVNATVRWIKKLPEGKAIQLPIDFW